MSDTATTSDLLQRARLGDQTAIETLFSRYLPVLRRWARGRLPQWARDLTDTDDIVQETLIRTLRRLDAFEDRGEGGFHAYLRQVLLNRIREELRAVQRRPAMVPLDQPAELMSVPSLGLNGQPSIEDYERALKHLDSDDREILIGRLEWGLTYKELAEAIGKPSAEAARKAAQRALVRLIEDMGASQLS